MSIINNKLYNIKKIFLDFSRRVKIVFGFPHIWICLIIVLLAIITLCVSYYFHINNQSYLSSIFANTSAGLITGLIVCLVSGVKQISKTGIISRKSWLEHISEMLKEYMEYYNKLRFAKFERINGDKELYDFIYDTAAHANWINEEIIHNSYSNEVPFDTMKYFKKCFGYDAETMADELIELREKLVCFDIIDGSKKDVLQYFNKVNCTLRKLNSAIYSEIKEKNIRLSEINRTII